VAKKHQQLPRVSFSILLALSLRPRHGYEIMQQVNEDSHGRINLGPGALYAAIKQLKDGGLIEDVETPGDERRRSYRLTGTGNEALETELAYYESALKLAAERRSAPGISYA
jgi:DNA-binding PadR family transcriptional regulator